jgi:crotonobetainyl-CoA:carnitine CoA-transferase CaiB-like acyl-CoA transferase
LSLFSQLRVIDASTLLAAPLAASILGDFGAEVVKVEDPKRGDPLRTYLPQRDGVSLIHKVTNRNKLTVAIDLRRVEGQELFRSLVKEATLLFAIFGCRRCSDGISITPIWQH